MKKFTITFLLITSFSSHSYAGLGFFSGIDAIHAKANHQAINSSSTSGPKNGDIKDSDEINYGLNVGVRFDLLNLYASGEMFFDQINTRSSNFDSHGASSSFDVIKIDNRYGAKANVGFAILPKITPFITYGLAGVNYENNLYSSNKSVSNSELSPLYGIGLLIDLPCGFSAKAAYDYQSLNIRYAESGSKIKTSLGVARLGLIYNF